MPSTDEVPDSEGGVTAPDGAVKASAVIADFTQFLEQQGVSDGAIAISYQGELIDSGGVSRQASDIAPVASLSKAITAVCTMKALSSHDLDSSATLLQIMPELLSGLDMPDTQLQSITVGQLLTHTSGIHIAHISTLGGDIPTMRLEQKLWQFEFIAKEGLSAEPGSGYYYANANYLILGLVIEAIVEDDYVGWCQREVLLPLGIDTAGLSPLWAVLSSFGGWEISATDYLTFANAYLTPADMVGLDPVSTPLFATVGGDARYGLGTLYRLTPAGAVYWHAGSFTWQSVEQSGRFGAYFVVFPNGYSAAVNLSDDLNDSRGAEIDRILYQLAD